MCIYRPILILGYTAVVRRSTGLCPWPTPFYNVRDTTRWYRTEARTVVPFLRGWQLAVSFDSRHPWNAIDVLESCIAEVKRWMLSNMLTLNDDKTELITFGSSYFTRKVPSITFKLGDLEIVSSAQVTNLGAQIFNSRSYKNTRACIYHVPVGLL